MSKFYFTFGSGHHDTRGRSLMGWYTTIEAADEMAARKIYFAKFGSLFSTSYDSAEAAGVKQFGLQYEPFGHMDLCSSLPQDKFIRLQAQFNNLLDACTDNRITEVGTLRALAEQIIEENK